MCSLRNIKNKTFEPDESSCHQLFFKIVRTCFPELGTSDAAVFRTHSGYSFDVLADMQEKAEARLVVLHKRCKWPQSHRVSKVFGVQASGCSTQKYTKLLVLKAKTKLSASCILVRLGVRRWRCQSAIYPNLSSSNKTDWCLIYCLSVQFFLIC